MPILFNVLDHDANFVKNIGSMNYTSLILLVETAQKNKLKCLSHIDFIGDAILNQQQLKVVKAELELLERFIDKKHAELFIVAIEETQKNPTYYLKLQGE